MEQTAEEIIRVRAADGALYDFAVEELRRQLEEAFSRAGRGEGYLAADLARALEFVLLTTSRDGRIVPHSEVEEVLGRMLTHAGYPEVLAAWRAGIAGRDATAAATVPTGAEILREVIATRLQVTGAAGERLSARVEKALAQLRIRSARPALIVELARHFEHETPAALPTPPRWTPHADTPYLVTETELRAGLTGPVLDLTLDGVWRMESVSRLFPRLHLTVRLTDFARRNGWRPPVTEMMVESDLVWLGERLAELRRTVAAAAGELPLYLTVPDLAAFTTDYLAAAWPAGRPAALELLGALIDGLGEKPFQLRTQ